MKQPSYATFSHSGICLDLSPEEAPQDKWTGARNIIFKESSSERVGGYLDFTPGLTLNGPIFAMMFLASTFSYWIVVENGGRSIFATDGVTRWDITPAAPTLANTEAGDWTGTTLNGVAVLNNGVDTPLYWSGVTTDKCLRLPGWPANTSANSVRAYKYHLIAMGITTAGVEYPHLIRWSSGADPGTIPQEWTPTPTNDAGDVLVADTPGKCVDGLPLRDIFVIYKEFSTYVLQYVAGEYVFTARKLFLSSGIQSNNCIAEINGEHWVLTSNDVIHHDGQTFQSVVTNTVRNALIGSINPQKIKQCCIVSRHNKQQIWVCIPTANNAWLNIAYTINTELGSVGVRDLPNASFVARGVVSKVTADTWDSDAGAWDDDTSFWNQQAYSPNEDSILMAVSDVSKLFSVDTVSSANGADIPAYLERTGLPIGDFLQRKIMTRIVPRLEGAIGTTIYIRLGSQAIFDAPVAWSNPIPYVIGTDIQVSAFAEGRLLAVRFESSGTEVWRLHSYRVEFVDQGLF